MANKAVKLRDAAPAPEDQAGDQGMPASAILEALPFYALLLDDRHHILQANRAVREELGLEPEAIVGKYCPAVVHGLDEPFSGCPLEEAVERGQAVEREALDQESGRWMRAVVYPVQWFTRDGGRVYFHMVFDTTEARRAEEQLRASREQLRELSRYLECVREDERTKIAREIHDELGQTLTALKMNLSWLARRLSPEQALLSARAESMEELIDEAIRTVTRVSSELRPGVLDDLGLADAVQWLTEEFGRRTDLACTFSACPETIVLDGERSTTIFRICQEALTNVARHAQATRVTVSLKMGTREIALRIRDNGKGIEESRMLDPRAFGLVGMRERACSWGGKVKISGSPGKGTLVAVSIPLVKQGESAC